MTLLLVDGSNILMRAAFGGDVEPDRSTPIACGIIERAARELRASHLVIALDYPGAPTWRHLEYPAYKANRTTDTAPWLVAGATEFQRRGWHVEAHAGFEADDVIATIALRTAARTGVTVLSNDSDLLVLTAGLIDVVRPLAGGELQEFRAADVCEKYRIPDAHLLIDYKAMVGEKGDNIAGVPGIGPKKAAALLHKFGTVENILFAGTRSPGYSKEADLVTKHRAAVELALRLVSLRPDVPVPPIAARSCVLNAARAA